MSTPTAATAATPDKDKTQGQPPSAVEFEPPLACVRRILKNSLPSSTNVGKDASAAFARACGIFIIYLTACSNDFAREHKRQTITANDVLAAIKELDFEDFTPEMKTFLESYRASEKSKKDAKVKAAAARAEEEEGSKATPSKEAQDDEEEDDVKEGDAVATPDDESDLKRPLESPQDETENADEQEETGKVDDDSSPVAKKQKPNEDEPKVADGEQTEEAPEEESK